MKTEAAYTSDVLREVRKLRPDAYTTKTSDAITAGIPDFFICSDGRTLWVEVKRSLSKNPNVNTLLTAAQSRTLSKMAAQGVPYTVLVRTPDTWKAYDIHGFKVDLSPSAKDVAAWLLA